MKRLSTVNNPDGTFKVRYINLSTNKKNFTKTLSEKHQILGDFDKDGHLIGIKFLSPVEFTVSKDEVYFTVSDNMTKVSSDKAKTEDLAVRSYCGNLYKKLIG